MPKPLTILILVFGGITVWFYLLLNDNSRTVESESEPQTVIVENEPDEATTTAAAPATTSPDAPPQTDAGMEFPVLDE